MMGFCQAIDKKTKRACTAVAVKVVGGVALCARHYAQWAGGRTIQTRRQGGKTRIRKES